MNRNEPEMRYPNSHLAAALLILTGGVSCARLETNNTVDVKPIEVKPIHIIADVNVNVRVERELDNFFSFENKYQQASSTQPATQPRAPGAAL